MPRTRHTGAVAVYESNPLDLEAIKERAEYAWDNRNSGLREQTLAKSGRDVPTLLAALEKLEAWADMATHAPWCAFCWSYNFEYPAKCNCYLAERPKENP